jgi:hypothetical protein
VPVEVAVAAAVAGAVVAGAVAMKEPVQLELNFNPDEDL